MEESSGRKNRPGMTWIIIIIIVIILIVTAVLLYSQQSGTADPSVNITLRFGSGTIFLTHDGGDSLSADNLDIWLNDGVIPFSEISLLPGQSWPFSIGKTLVIPYVPSPVPQTLTVYYDTGASRTEIFTATVPPATEFPTATPTISGPASEPVTAVPTPATTAPTPSATVPATVPVATTPPSGPPQASFTASPRSGPYPLTISFTDLSTGAPDQWEWNFGDGAGSTGKDPVHTYTATGNYTVSLKVANAEGANTRIMQNYIVVGSPETREVTLDADGPGSLLPGGFALFKVTGSGARIKVGGRIITPEPGDSVRIVLGNDGRGKISVHYPFILEWTFDDTEVEVNGQPAGKGRISDISIPAYDGFVSNLTLFMPPESMKGRLIVEGTTTDLSTMQGGLALRDFIPDRAGDLVVDTSLPGSTYFQGRTAGIRE